MDTKPLLFAIIGFLLGGFVVSVAATQLDEDNTASGAEMTMSQMSAGLTDKSGDDFDAAFLSAMIEHHEGAITMAELAETRAEHQQIRQLAQEVIAAQDGEIAQMRQWQQDWGYDDGGSSAGHHSE
jgi:uncharacterized protein (DUF305 family)